MDSGMLIDPAGEDPVPKRKRGKVANPESWKTNIRKKLRTSGQEYISSRGKRVASRDVRPKDCSNCLKKCNEKFPEAERLAIHEAFWGLGDLYKQKIFISGLVEELPVKARVADMPTKRQVNIQYFLRFTGIPRQSVCKGFFLATLDISDRVVREIVRNRDKITHIPREELRGKAKTGRATPEEVKDFIREHIRSYIKCPNESSSNQPGGGKGGRTKETENEHVMEKGLNLKIMYDSYLTQCQWEDRRTAKEWMYRDIAKKEFRLKFIDPLPSRKQKLDVDQGQDELLDYNGAELVIYTTTG